MASGYHKDGLRESLIEKGRELLLKEGLSGFSLRALAAELGVSHAAPYRHFQSKEGLVTAIVEADSERFNQALARGVEGVEDPFERLFRLGEAYVNFYVENPAVLILFTSLPEQLARQGKRLELFAQAYGKACDQSSAQMGNGERGLNLLREASSPFASRFPGLSQREIIFGYWAKVHGLASLLVAEPGFLPKRGRAARVRELIRTPF
jgi:AcrR family transcriptional regulator